MDLNIANGGDWLVVVEKKRVCVCGRCLNVAGLNGERWLHNVSDGCK
jgi:hypothetical protein